jgi:predicted ATPase with chaperone activity
MVSKYQNRIDIHLEVQRVPIARLASLDSGESSRVIQARVEAARSA